MTLAECETLRMATPEYAETLAWLYALEAARGMDFKLDRIGLALQTLGDPQTRYPCIHVAGTNGKGSVSAMVHAMFAAAGYRVGLYVSPHLVSFTERIRVGSDVVAEAKVVELACRIRAAATASGIELTFFEFVTVMAFQHFADEAVDVAVIEVGLGGRLDATNVITPLVSVITSIDLDHEDYLGSHVESIAAEKCGVIKEGIPVVVGRVAAAADAVIEETAANRQARLCRAQDDFVLSGSINATFSGLGAKLDGITLALRGEFQVDNAALAIAAVRLASTSLPVADEAVRTGLSTVQWPGRLEVLRGDPMVIVDGAHNAAAVRCLVAELPALVGCRKLHLLFAVMRDKRWLPMLDLLLPHVATVTLTAVLPGRGEDPSRLAEAIGTGVPVSVDTDAPAAFGGLLDRFGKGSAILVTGSLFLVGLIYPVLARRRQQLAYGASLE